MTAVLAQVHEVFRAADDDLDPALAACVQLVLAGPHLAGPHLASTAPTNCAVEAGRRDQSTEAGEEDLFASLVQLGHRVDGDDAHHRR